MRFVWVLLTLLFATQSLAAEKVKGTFRGVLVPGASAQGELLWKTGEYKDDVWKIEVGPHTAFLRIQTLEAHTDTDLYLLRDPGDDLESSVVRAATDSFSETVQLSRWEGQTLLETGTYYLHVVGYVEGKKRPSDDSTYQVKIQEMDLDQATDLAWGAPTKALLRADTGMMSLLRLTVPANTPQWRVDVLDAQMDVNLYLKQGRAPLNRVDSDFKAESPLARESFSKEGKPETKSQDWYILVTGKINQQHSETLTLEATLGNQHPNHGKPVPTVQWPRDAWEKNLSAMVELSNSGGRGSGCLVSPHGLIVTNLHVVKEASGEVGKRMAVALILDPGKPPTELFWADVIQVDRDKDLALLRISETLTDDPLPRSYAFPYFADITREIPSLGEEMYTAGFPGQGGTGTRTSLTVTRGIVSGYEDTDFGRIVKTDAEINYGNSGGAALDRRGRLFALPTSIIGEDTGQLGFLHPLALMSPEWWKTIQKDRS